MENRRKFIKTTSLLAASAGIFGYHVSHSANKRIPITGKNKKTMLQHNVYFFFKPDVSDSDKKKFLKGTQDFAAAVKEVKKAEIGVPAATPKREVIDDSFGLSLFTWFDSIEDHNIYQEHPAHKKYIEDFAPLWEKVIVYDSELV